MPVGLDVSQKRHDHRCLEVFHTECERSLADLALHEGEQQPESAAISGHRARASLPLRRQPVSKECPQLTVTQASGQRRQTRLDVLTVAVPVDQGMNGEGVAQIVNVGTNRRLSSDAGGVDELPKRNQNIRVEEAGADDRDEEAGCFAPSLQLVPPSGVGDQGTNSAGLQRNLARPAELGGSRGSSGRPASVKRSWPTLALHLHDLRMLATRS